MDDKLVGQGVVSAFLEDHKRDRRWRNIRFFTTLFFILLFFSFSLFPSLFHSSSSNEKGGYVALVRMQGQIMPGADFSAQEVIPNLIAAFEDPEAKGVVLDIDSGGGSAVQASIIYDRLISLKEEHPETRLVVVGEDALASGAYMVALAADKIYVNPNSITGSVGVISKGFGFTEVIKNVGVTRRVFTAGTNKDRLDPFEPLTEADRLKLKSVLDDVYKYFVNLVKLRRGDKLKGNDAELFSGDFWTGSQAVELGLVDGTGNLSGVLKKEFDVKMYHDYSVTPSFMQEIVRNIGVEMSAIFKPKASLQAISR